MYFNISTFRSMCTLLLLLLTTNAQPKVGLCNNNLSVSVSSLLDFQCLSLKIHVSNDQLISSVASGYTKFIMETEHKYTYRFYIQVLMR